MNMDTTQNIYGELDEGEAELKIVNILLGG